MNCKRCGECCKETEMLLSNKDVERLERSGYERNAFAKFDAEGYAVLRNLNGVCFFFNNEKLTCRIRKIRPEGCRIYPVMHDEEKGIVVDSMCPAKGSISDAQRERKGLKVLRLLAEIDSEAFERRKKR